MHQKLTNKFTYGQAVEACIPTPGVGNFDVMEVLYIPHILFRHSTAKKYLYPLWVENVFNTTIFKKNEVHVAESIVSIHEIVEMIGTSFVC
jgi:hypothetical protein